MSTTREFLMPIIRDQDGREMSPDEALSNWLQSGTARPLPPAYDDSEAPMPDQLADPEITLLGPSETGQLAWRRNQLKQVIDSIDEGDRWLIWRHQGQQKSFARIAADDGVTRQAVQQRYARIKARLIELAADLPQPDMDFVPPDWGNDVDDQGYQ